MVRRPRRGIVLVVVLVVIVMLALAAYTFVSLMIVESEAVRFDGQQTQARCVAESGVEFARCLVRQRDSLGNVVPPPVVDDIPVYSTDGALAGRFSIRPLADDVRPGSVLTNLSSRLNVNLLAAYEPAAGREALLPLPGMSPEIADAILDWIDADDDPRELGAESEYYSNRKPAHACANGPLQSIGELLRVRGVTSAALFGTSAARAAGTTGDSDLNIESGWSRWLTTRSNESNLRQNGQPRIDLNHSNLEDLFDALEKEWGTDVARFVVAYRIHGPHRSSASSPPHVPPPALTAPTLPAARHSRAPGELFTIHLSDEPVATQERGGLILNAGARYRIHSLFDLIGVQVPQLDQSGRLITSPWSPEPAQVAEYLPRLADALSTSPHGTVAGRINIFLAEEPVLASVPDMAPSVAAAIVERQSQLSADVPQTLAWLLTENLVDLPQLRRIAPHLTTGGDVFAGRVVGRTDPGGRTRRLEFTLDSTGQPTRLLSLD